jgi:hypothetical protein
MWWGWLAQLLLGLVGPLVWSAVQLLGFSMVSYIGIDILMDYFKSQIHASFAGLPSSIVSILSLMKLDVGINIILSAIVVSATLKGIKNGARKTSVWNPPGTASKTISMPF